jgi:hypothetical protein
VSIAETHFVGKLAQISILQNSAVLLPVMWWVALSYIETGEGWFIWNFGISVLLIYRFKPPYQLSPPALHYARAFFANAEHAKARVLRGGFLSCRVSANA